MGLALLLAAANVFLRDTEHLIEVLLLAWFFLTPIFYAMSIVPNATFLGLDIHRWVFTLNPMATLVTDYRYALMWGFFRSGTRSSPLRSRPLCSPLPGGCSGALPCASPRSCRWSRPPSESAACARSSSFATRRRGLSRAGFLALLGRASIEHEEFWALDGVDVEIAPGETLGIIGPNGSGKSTMLKLLAGTIAPTDGSIQASGSVFGLLELGAGMHPDLTGRENIFLNGSFLGLNRAEVRALYDQIVAFAELEQFIDTPVKHYSSGMFMRLGFAIAINVDPDILLIDEVLAVGDARFAAKCYEALAEVKRRGRTMLLVSHDPFRCVGLPIVCSGSTTGASACSVVRRRSSRPTCVRCAAR